MMKDSDVSKLIQRLRDTGKGDLVDIVVDLVNENRALKEEFRLYKEGANAKPPHRE